MPRKSSPDPGIPAADIFALYFDRKPPFDGEESKEFPDAFAIEGLGRWRRESEENIHIVTNDKAMLRAALAGEMLPIQSVAELLRRAGAEFGDEADDLADAILATKQFEQSFRESLGTQIEEATFVYYGELANGEAFGGRLLDIVDTMGWSVAGKSERRLTLLLECQVKVQVEIQYEDREFASYDREDRRYYGTESATTYIDEEVDIEVLVEVDGKTDKVVEAKILTREIPVNGRFTVDY